jgi:hypothetical protein
MNILITLCFLSAWTTPFAHSGDSESEDGFYSSSEGRVMVQASPKAASVILYARNVTTLPYPDERGRPIILPPETKYRVEALNRQAGLWREGQELLPPEPINERGDWSIRVMATPLNSNGQPLPAPIRPYITQLGDFTSVAPRQQRPVTQTPRTRSSRATAERLETRDLTPQSEAEVMAALRAFHNGSCNGVDSAANLRERFNEAWEAFVQANNGFSRVAKERARDVDLVTRTTLHESSPPGWFERGENEKYRTHSKMHNCERAIISMSMVNRIRMCTPGGRTGYYECKKPFDSVGVITEPNQYNIWFDRYLNRQTLVSCYYRSDLGSNVPYFHADGRPYSANERAMYENYRVTYGEMLPIVMDLFCYSDRCRAGRREGDILKNRHMSEMIRAEEVELKERLEVLVPDPEEGARGTLPLTSPIAQNLVVPKIVTYFHPRDMGGCPVQAWPGHRFIRAGYVHCTDSSEKRFLVRDRISFIDDNGAQVRNPEPNRRYRFRILTNNGGMIPGDTVCQGARVEGLFGNEPNEVSGCLPKGYFPACADRAKVAGDFVFPGRDSEERRSSYRSTNEGLKISFNLTRIAEVEAIKAVNREWINPEMEARSRRLNQGHQKYQVGLKCIYAPWNFRGTREEGFRDPEVGGKCDQTLLPSTDWGEREPGFSRPVD